MQQRHSSLLLVLVVILMGTVFGFIGVILAPPLAVTIEILLRNYVTPDNTKMDHIELTGLQKRFQFLKEKLKEVDLAPETVNLVKRLEKLLNRVQHLKLQRDK